MSPAVLQDYDHYGRLWVLDPPSGHLSPGPADAFAQPAGERLCHGFVHVLSHGAGGCAALYAESSVLWFQYGGRRWNGDDVSVRCGPRPDGSRLLTVTGPGAAPWEAEVPAPDRGPFDPAYDWTDTLADDFFLWVAEQLSDARHRSVLREHYLRGFTPV
ncbi:hypothetical protein ACIGJO_26600 [Streptomyces sp. NPDC079020]|uniref:hypothetical protein n=1 Tax=Streptomyces sp. NPDC079020 TaxID=3365722 RepID=UPI0037D3D710